MSLMRLSEAARAIPAELRGEDCVFETVSTDTRTLAPRTLFVALKGERFDGHDFLGEAAAKHAAGALVQKAGSRIEEQGLSDRLPLLVVEDTKKSLGTLAAYWRKKFSLPLVALTGSNGKTTVKQMLSAICARRGPVLATVGNLNNHIGVPLTLLALSPSHRFAVIEMGANHPGEIAALAAIAEPAIALVTNAGDEHL